MKNPSFLAILFLFAALNVSGVQLANAQGSVDTDREALVALYDLTDGDNWESNSFWKSDQPIGQWYGVDTDRDGRVTRILLPRNNLSGPIPTEIGNLTNSETLFLELNNLSGSVPLSFANLLLLRFFYAYDLDNDVCIPASLEDWYMGIPFNEINDIHDLTTPLPVCAGPPTSSETEEIPATFSLEQNYPNPFNPSTAIEYSLDAPGHVELAIYNMTGAKVATLVYGYMPAGSHSVAWKSDVPSGTYLYRLTASGHSETRYMTLVR